MLKYIQTIQKIAAEIKAASKELRDTLAAFEALLDGIQPGEVAALVKEGREFIAAAKKVGAK